MRLLIDTNVLIDVLAKREDYWEDSSYIWKLGETNQADCYISVLSVTDLVYILRKELDPEKTEAVMKGLRLIFNFASLDAQDLIEAASLRWDDFEDAVQSVTASSIKADYIISRNVKDFNESKVPVLSPSEFLNILFS